MMNRKGFSMIELIVTIAIMAVALSAVGFSISYVQSTRTKDCAERMNSAIVAARTNAMSRTGENKIEFYKTDSGVYMTRTISGTAQNTEKIGGANVTVKYTLGTGAARTEYTLSDTDTITLEFNKSSGAFRGVTPEKITVTGGGKEMTITLYSLTGKSVLG